MWGGKKFDYRHFLPGVAINRLTWKWEYRRQVYIMDVTVGEVLLAVTDPVMLQVNIRVGAVHEAVLEEMNR